MIVRAADFYGPGVGTSVMQETVYKNFLKGKKANWMADATKIHSFTYVPDAAKATTLLGNTEDAYNQVWHLPTSNEKLNGKEWIQLFANAMKAAPKYSVLSKGSIKVLGFFIPVLKELHEMLNQYDQDYFFNSDKFQQRFPQFLITPAQKAVQEIINYK